jgi:hypothetical protein
MKAFEDELGIGVRSIKEAGQLARSVITYIKENIH